MKIILTADVPDLGGPGDLVHVKDGYARNFLFPTGAAVKAAKAIHYSGAGTIELAVKATRWRPVWSRTGLNSPTAKKPLTTISISRAGRRSPPRS